MENMYTLKKPDSIKKRRRKGTGISAGQGKTCGRGQDGQRSRSGSTRRPWFEGGQMPLQRRVPKRGFHNYTQKEYQILNLSDIERVGITDVGAESLKEHGILHHIDKRIKVLGGGEIKKPVTVTADAFTKSAEEKIKKAGGEVIIRNFPPVKTSEQNK